MNQYVIPSSMGGLSGRLKCLVSSIKISTNTKREILLYWPKNPPCNCNFSDLFENDIKELSKEELRGIVRKGEFQILKKFEKINLKKRFIIIGDLGFVGFSKENLLLKFKKTSANIRKEIFEILKKLKIKKSVQKEIDKFHKKYFKKDIIGVHIRRGDFRRITIGGVSSDKKFIEEIKREIKLNPKIKFFLATEEEETEGKFKKIFGDKIISYQKKTKKREDEGSVKEALIELLLLSKCKKILGSFGSTFTELAWFFGECKPKIKIVTDEKELEIYKVKERKKDNLFNSIKKIIYETITPLHIRLLDKV